MEFEEADRFLTVAEVAERLRLHPITVRRHIKAGRIRAVRIGRAVRVPEAELRNFGSEGRRIAEGLAAYDAKYPKRVSRERRLREMTPKEWEQAREAARRMIQLRDSMPPMGISTTELIREGRREIEERDEHRARGRR